jgi:hypothetical protein
LACILLVAVSSSLSVNRLLFWFKKTVLFVQSGFFSFAFFLGGGGVWGDAHLRLTQNFAYTPYPATTQKKGQW